MKKNAGWLWINKMGQAWIDKNPKSIPPLFAEKFQYYETPFEKPLTSKKELINLWQDVPESQKDVLFDFEIISEKNNQYIAHWYASFIRKSTGKKTYLDGIFLVALNQKGLCTLFKQWWVNNENK
ncbi:hypothetical protein A3D78_04595 [Candidatus Gottesmanbacteria bacterium RIFCSPHIGHO2_02_FULL_39_14]|uniref:SnoaL-like domain-containing protein n=1 Tax=Candidatus Gottesmanbacteria bacterium RIFCSPHIGHO2_02_FULL_39_14 TaxID=1798383 RepID=A0A1F6A3D4_9BACT|nr:MAG: hypothetical protein A3D78_04595 [Candidatus Gottesmanbacteria bacterium RIFCSPHIGHO2_02_FULL_39_14]